MKSKKKSSHDIHGRKRRNCKGLFDLFDPADIPAEFMSHREDVYA